MLRFLVVALAIAVICFAITWAISVKMRNYGFLDVAWSYGVAVLAPLYAWNSPGAPLRKWMLTAIGVMWSLRLGTYILIRVLKHHPQEDVRYRTLRERWSGSGKFLLFFELQAVLVAIFSLPFLFAAFDRAPSLHPLAIAGAAIAVAALCGETVADAQMQAFKTEPGSGGRVCERGLWRYSRHPNYFFESLIWWGFSIAVLPSPLGWMAIICPLLMLYFLFQVTGIPLTEKHAVQSKGDAYRRYQRTTSAFIPWFPRA